MRFLRRALSGLFLLALTAGLLAYAGTRLTDALAERAARENPARPPSERVYAANVVPVTSGPETPVLTAFGEVSSRRTLEIRATAPGRIIELGAQVEEGGRVAEGDLIARIDPADAEMAVALARADLADARAERDEAASAVNLAIDDLAAARDQVDLRQRALDRQSDLSDRGVGAATSVEEADLALASARQSVLQRRQALADAEARVAMAETAVDRRRVALDDAERDLDETEIRASFDGLLADVTVTRGGLVGQNEQLATLVDPDALEAAFRVSTPEYTRLLDDDGNLAPGPLTVSLEVSGYTLASAAEVTREAASVAEGETGRRLFARLDQPQGFRPGDFVRVRIEEPTLDRVARLPSSAVDTDGSVLALGPEDRLELARVDILRRQGDTVLVAADALEGREVVAERSPLLGTGIKVRPVRRGADGSPVSDPPEMVELSEARRQELIAMVEGNARMPEAAKARVLDQLRAPRVAASVVARIESRGG